MFIATLGGLVFLLSKMRITINEPVTRQGLSTIVTKGIFFGVVCLSDPERMCLRSLVELGGVGE